MSKRSPDTPMSHSAHELARYGAGNRGTSTQRRGSNEALSVDNLFVLLFIIGSFAVPRIAKQKVLLFGILLALVARTGFIFGGAALITIFGRPFYLLGWVTQPS